MGTPQLRCRLMHQSLRPDTIGVMRFSPTGGTHDTAETAASAASRKPSTEANHCWRGKRRR